MSHYLCKANRTGTSTAPCDKLADRRVKGHPLCPKHADQADRLFAKGRQPTWWMAMLGREEQNPATDEEATT